MNIKFFLMADNSSFQPETKKKLFWSNWFAKDFSHISYSDLCQKIQDSSRINVSYLVLLFGSGIVTTLGLLMDSAPVVIGGMIISPLMWPLMKVATGIAIGKEDYIRQAVRMIFLSIIIALISSIFITFISPIRLINSEIITRTNPTLIDIIIALVAGGVAALGILKPRVSESLAGVAIATSLMPPLCVSGIGIALYSPQLAVGGFMLFMANVIAIIFVASIVFGRTELQDSPFTDSQRIRLRRRGLIIMTVFLIITAIPLFFLLRSYSFLAQARSQVEIILQEEFSQISPDINLSQVQTDLVNKDGREVLSVNAVVQIPSDTVIDFQQKQNVVKSLEDEFGTAVDLNLVLATTISIISEEDKNSQDTKEFLENSLTDQVAEMDSSLTIESIRSSLVKFDSEGGRLEETEASEATFEEGWYIDLTMTGDINQVFTINQRRTLEENLSNSIGQRVSLDVRILPQIKIRSNPEIESQERNQNIRETIDDLLSKINKRIDLSSLTITETEIDENKNEEPELLITAEIIIPNSVSFTKLEYNILYNNLVNQFEDISIVLEVEIIEKQVFNESILNSPLVD